VRADAALAARVGGRLDRLEVDAFLKLSSPFVRLPPSAVWDLAGLMRRRALASGEALVRQGEAGDTFYLVTSGRLEVLRAPDGRPRLGRSGPQRVAQLGPGDCVGEAALLADQPRTATVRALERAEVLALSRDQFRATVRQHQSAGAFFRELFLARYRAAPRQLLAVTDPVSTLMPRLRESQVTRVVAVFGVGMLLLALLSILSIRTAARPVAWLTLLLGGLLPAAVYVAYMRQRDLLGDIPLRTLFAVSAAAAVIGVPLAIELEGLAAPTSPLLGALLVALVEEPLKLAGVLWAMARWRYRFALDGVIFGITAAMGFGGLESLGYGYLALYAPRSLCGIGVDGPSCMVTTVWLRTASVFLGHGPWTAIVCATLFRERGRGAAALTRPVALAFGLAVGLHTLWDLNPVLFGVPVALAGVLTLRHLMQQGLSQQAGALSALTLMSTGDRVDTGAPHVTCVRCTTAFPASAIYCVRCGLSLA
jgi:CRP-like cAMP-binding protein